MTDPATTPEVNANGWSKEAIKAFSDRSIAIHELNKAEQAVRVARATVRQAQRTYEAAIDAARAAIRTLPTEPSDAER